MFPDSPGHLLRLPGKAGVDPSHHPLQLRELPHHLRGQVGLAQEGCPIQGIRWKVKHLRKPPADSPNPLHPLPHRAQAGFVDDLLKVPHPIGQGAPGVVLEKEGGIPQAGPHHPFIPLPDHALLVRGAVTETQEYLGGGVSPGKGHELALFMERGLDDRGGKLQEFPGDRSQHPDRPFSSAHKPSQEIVGKQGPHAPLFLHLPYLLEDPGFALLGVAQDVGAPETLEVLISSGNTDLPWPEEPVAPGSTSCHKMSQPDRDDLLSKQAHQPADRPEKGKAGVVPAHGLGTGDAPGGLGEELGKHLLDRTARRPHREEQVFPLPHLPSYKLAWGGVVAPSEPQGGLGGVARLV